MYKNAVLACWVACSFGLSSFAEDGEVVDWSVVEPVETMPASAESVSFKDVGEVQLAEEGVKRRDSSDIIRVDGVYYIWYTKIHQDAPGCPDGWAGTVWFATSEDGHVWTEQGQAIGRGQPGAWDSYGAYTPNILVHEGVYYLAYTAMSAQTTQHRHRQASIGLAVADTPAGPWRRMPHNPVVAPGADLSSPDGFLCDDAVFVVRGGVVWFYYKGFPRLEDEAGRAVRYRAPRDTKGKPGGSTFLLAAKAASPKDAFEKSEAGPLHRGHEAALWLEPDGAVGSFGLGWGDLLYYRAGDGLGFKPAHPLQGRPAAAGFFRQDFGGVGARPAWGMKMSGSGLQRFEIDWPGD